MDEIPVFQDDSADFEQEIELGDQVVTLSVTWNARYDVTGFFFLTFTDQDGNILRGVKMVPGWLLLDWHRGTLNFVGDIILLKVDDEAGDLVTYDNFGDGWNLFYMDADEVDGWKDLYGF